VSTETGFTKPVLQIFEIALNQANCKPENTVMIGDRLDNDIIPAKQIGTKTIRVKQGFAKYQPVYNKPDYTINMLDDINIFF
jgi:8-oxo-dGTP diphosphatase/putative hydrolase of the HAD superfamily